ncbi:PTS sugar transporter subunit IIB [Anaerosinus massiliensis]|uniref:PTS sugar transporter subunit IIB n=1 Tax=Massilibacillus massiliensis TaxID=1806837 RepID=UPI000DA5F665|nr:PTS sugar transporter [Massilibacillus massiliensis]
MKDNITILCCCGAGICTSNYLKEEIEDRMKAENIKNVKVLICRVTDLEEQIGKADLVVTTVEIKAVEGTPMVRALGIMLDDAAAEKALSEIVSVVKSL